LQSDERLKNLLTKEELAYLLSASPADSGTDYSPTNDAEDNDLTEREQQISRHLDTVIRGLEMEIIELRTRVSRLESGFAVDNPNRTYGLLDTSSRLDAENHSESNDSLSRVQKYKSQRGRWF
jgi:hypothetical protein